MGAGRRGEEERCLGGGLEVRGKGRGGWWDERVGTTKQRRAAVEQERDTTIKRGR